MKVLARQIAVVGLLSLSACYAFTNNRSPRQIPKNGRLTFVPPSRTLSSPLPFSPAVLFAGGNEDKDDEVQRLKSMAAKLRAEAAALEAEQAEMAAAVTRKAFDSFDTNRDGQISISELKAGLEKALKTELSEKRVQKLLEQFDKSGDGTLQPDEFVTIEQLRNKLDAITRDEKAAATKMRTVAKQEEEMFKLLEAQLEQLNDREPTNVEKVLSVLPYLFPLLDCLQFAAFLVMGNPENVFAQAIAVAYLLYRSIPFSGFIAFFTLSFLSGNIRINRLIRFNMQQAIFLDIALFFPGLVGALYGLLARGLNFSVSPTFAELASNSLFFIMLALVTYCSASSLLGKAPDKIPLISNAVKARMPTVDMLDPSRFLGGRKDDDSNKKDK